MPYTSYISAALLGICVLPLLDGLTPQKNFNSRRSIQLPLVCLILEGLAWVARPAAGRATESTFSMALRVAAAALRLGWAIIFFRCSQGVMLYAL